MTRRAALTPRLGRGRGDLVVRVVATVRLLTAGWHSAEEIGQRLGVCRRTGYRLIGSCLAGGLPLSRRTDEQQRVRYHLAADWWRG